MNNNKLNMYGGLFGGFIPLLILVGGLIWLSIEERGGTKPFWACAWIAIVVGLFLSKNKSEYCESAMRGISNQTGIVIVSAWLFAGVFGELMSTGGLVNGLLWMGMQTGATGSTFTLIVFFAAMLFALGTGTSVGTCIALTPVLFPAGYFLGADPTFLGLAILSGAAFGDNLAPISDTTIVSAYTQGAKMKDVVKSRFPLAISAAFISATIFFFWGGDGELSTLPEIDINLNPSGLLMLIALIVVVISTLKGKHLIESLIYGNVTAIFIGVVSKNFKLSDIFSIPTQKGISTGMIQNGIESVIGAIIFAILILAVTQILIECGIMQKILNLAEKSLVVTVRKAEFFIVGITILASVPISANAPAELLVGPSIVKPVGKKFNLSPARCANLMDCAVCTIFFILPWHIAVAVWYSTMQDAAEKYNIVAPSVSTALYNPYSWALLLVLLFSIMTGWNRKFSTV